MVFNILKLLDQNSDRPTLQGRPSLLDFLYSGQNKRVNFDEAQAGLQEYARQFNGGQIPPYMNCVRKVGTEELIRQFNMNQANPMEEHGFHGNQQITQIPREDVRHQTGRTNG